MVLFWLAAYLFLILGVVWVISRRQTLDSYLLNKKSTGLAMMTISNVATLVGGGATVGAVSAFCNTGIAYGALSLSAYVVGMGLVWLIARRVRIIGRRAKARSIVDFFGARFGRRNRRLMVALQMFYLIPWICMQMVVAGAVLNVLFGISLPLAMAIVSLSTILYSSMGGLRADIVADNIHFWVMLLIFAAMGSIAFADAGSVGALADRIPAEALNPLAFKGSAWFIISALLSGFMYITMAPVWQRIFAAKDDKTAARSFYLALPVAVSISCVILFLGMYARVNLPAMKNPDTAFFELIDLLLPDALAGIGFAAVIATVMSSIDSIFVAGSTIIYDEFVEGRKTKGILYARLTTVGFGLISTLVAVAVPDIVSLGMFVLSVGFIAAPAVLAGFFSKRISDGAVFWSILVPLVFLVSMYWKLSNSIVLFTAPAGVAILLLFDPIVRLFKGKTK